MTNGILRNAFVNGLKMESPHSPTDTSEDSIEVKVEAIRSKRKSCEASRRLCCDSGPLKKRICARNNNNNNNNNNSNSNNQEEPPFRPWSPADPLPRQYFRPPSPPPQPIDLKKRSADVRIPIHPAPSLSALDCDRVLQQSTAVFPKLKQQQLNEQEENLQQQQQQRKEQRNYKNMTRERRIEANARERTRVHTISAAFDTLRKSVPAYSHSQKLSKLSVLRIACSYIVTLNNILQDSPEVKEAVETVGRTIQREGKTRKKKDDE